MNYKTQITFEVPNSIPFKDLSHGDTFLYCGRLFQKGRFSNTNHAYDKVAAWDLERGDQIHFNDNDKVEPRCITINVEAP